MEHVYHIYYSHLVTFFEDDITSFFLRPANKIWERKMYYHVEQTLTIMAIFGVQTLPTEDRNGFNPDSHGASHTGPHIYEDKLLTKTNVFYINRLRLDNYLLSFSFSKLCLIKNIILGMLYDAKVQEPKRSFN